MDQRPALLIAMWASRGPLLISGASGTLPRRKLFKTRACSSMLDSAGQSRLSSLQERQSNGLVYPKPKAKHLAQASRGKSKPPAKGPPRHHAVPRGTARLAQHLPALLPTSSLCFSHESTAVSVISGASSRTCRRKTAFGQSHASSQPRQN